MCRFLLPPGRHQKCCPNLRYLVFFEIRKNVEKDAKSKNIKILCDVSFFAASGTATIWVTESPLPSFFYFKILRKIKKYDFQKS